MNITTYELNGQDLEEVNGGFLPYVVLAAGIAIGFAASRKS